MDAESNKPTEEQLNAMFADAQEQVLGLVELIDKYPEHAKMLTAQKLGVVLGDFLHEFMPAHDLQLVQMEDGAPKGLIDVKDERNVGELIAHFFGLDPVAYDAEEAAMRAEEAETHDPDLEALIAGFEDQFKVPGPDDVYAALMADVEDDK
jgi:hypothetical protein